MMYTCVLPSDYSLVSAPLYGLALVHCASPQLFSVSERAQVSVLFLVTSRRRYLWAPVSHPVPPIREEQAKERHHLYSGQTQ